jgi:hypothetical protein
MNTVINTALLATGAPALGATGVGGAAVAPSAPAGTDAARFQTLMAATDPAMNTAAPSATLPTTLPIPAHSSNTLVSDLSNSLSKVSNDVNGTFQRYQQGVKSGEVMSMTQMLQAHGELMVGLIKWDLTNKGIQKSTQSVDTIVKTQ